MRELIENTAAFQELNTISQKMLLKRANRIQVEEEIIIAINVGLAQWKKQTPLQARWQEIVEQIVK